MTPMRWRVALLGASLILSASPGHANGRFPLSQRLFQDPSSPDHLYLSATFGLLVSRDRGQNWYHVCESALTPELLESDILFELMPDGAMLAALVRPLAISSDCGCGWQPVLGTGTSDWVKDIAKAGANSVVALMPDGVRHSTDGGRTWGNAVAIEISGGLRYQSFTIDAAPSNPQRLYVSITLNMDADAGIDMITPALLVSNDAGATWSTRPITGAPSGDQPFIAAVHPTNPDIVYVRTDNWALNEETELDDAYDGLFVTDDGGMTFREVLRKGGKLFGFALSPDGQTVLAGFGDPVQATRMVNFDELGIYRASTADHAFTQALNAPVSCLTWNANGLYACFDELVGHSADATIPPMVAGFSPILAYENVRGPLACNAEVCLPEWQEGREDVPSVCDRLGAECNVDPAANVIACSAPTGGAGGMAGAAGSGAAGSGAIAGSMSAGAPSGGSSPTAGMAGTMITAGAGGSTGGSGQAGAAPGNDGGTSSSCGCRSHHATGARSAAVALALLALLRLRRRAKPTHSD